MEQYIIKLQKYSGWYRETLQPILKCCINSHSTTGYCQICMENFKYRLGEYYEGFVYPNDDELLKRLESGNKPFAQFARCERDKLLEKKIKKHGLFLVRKFRNKWGVLQYDVVKKNTTLKLSDLADLESINQLLNIDLDDKLIVDLEKMENLPKIYQGIIFGYPFYTLDPENYKSC